MNRLQILKSALIGGASVMALAHPAAAKIFDIPNGDLAAALGAYMQQAGVEIVYSDAVVRGHRSQGAKGNFTETAALDRILEGTGFTTKATANAIGIVPEPHKTEEIRIAQAVRRAPAAPAPAAMTSTAVETVVVTAQKKSENIQNVPIAVTALSQAQLTERQIAGGPDLVKEVPNLTFSKTNFTGYNIEIRGIGTQAISVTTDPAVAVAFNDTPFIRNHFFEQEFYDLRDVEVLRGPQGTLYGRNATAGVVDIKSALPTGDYEAMLSADFGNYSNRRFEGMLNIPVVGDKLDIRMAGEWTKRHGYTQDTALNTAVDGRDLRSSRLTIGFNPSERLHTDFVWEHFSEDDDRMRTAKQLCEKDPGPTSLDGIDLTTLQNPPRANPRPPGFEMEYVRTWLSQGCLPTSLYAPSAFETPNGQTLPFVALGEFLVNVGSANGGGFLNPIDPYASQTQSMNLRSIESLIRPHYRAKNDTLEFNLNFAITPQLTLISSTGYSSDFLFSTEDFNRFDTAPGIFSEGLGQDNNHQTPPILPNGVYCDPQVGCSTSMVAEDLSDERASQLNQEIRLNSQFSGPLNFSVGTNYTHYQTSEDYYVFFNLLTALTQWSNGSGPGQFAICDVGPFEQNTFVIPIKPFIIPTRSGKADSPSVLGCGTNISFVPYGPIGTYIDPNPISSLNGQGHNYFRSENPYALNSWAAFGEVYYDVTPNLKLTGGLRWTDDRKVFQSIPSAAFELGGGYPVAAVVKQGWNEWTGRTTANWSPELDFTDQSMFYASYAHGYKGGGANPPPPLADFTSQQSFSTHPPTFTPEHIEAFEIGTKNTALDGTLTLNADIFYYNYHGYQISQIVDRTSINLNFNATVKGAELESVWEPSPGLKFNVGGGVESSAVDHNQFAIDLMDRTAGMPGWVVVRPFASETSNCILPAVAVAQVLNNFPYASTFPIGLSGACDAAYGNGKGEFAVLSAVDRAAFAQVGFDPSTAPNGGEGFAKSLAGHKLPNTPPFTLSAGAQYTVPVTEDWAATLRADFYWQGNSFARIFNDRPYDQIHGYTNLNLALILNSANGWQVLGYVKNVFDTTAITGDFLNSDDTALTTNVFLTDPRLFGIRVTKHLDESDGFWGSEYSGADIITGIFSDKDGNKPVLWIELGGDFDQLSNGSQTLTPAFLPNIPGYLGSPLPVGKPPGLGPDWETKISLQPEESAWVISAAVRYGRASTHAHLHNQTNPPSHIGTGKYLVDLNFPARYQDTQAEVAETHEILDFTAGKDAGLGALGLSGTGELNFGLRYAAFTSKSHIAIGADPDSNINLSAVPRYHYHKFNAQLDARRSFRGVGPSLSWDASMPFAGNEQDGAFSFDWGANGAVLFGKQRARGSHSTKSAYYCQNNWVGYQSGCPPRSANAPPLNQQGGFFNQNSHTQRTAAFNRARGVVVPNIGAFVGISYRLPNARLSFGYRADEFFGAMDGGIDTRKSENVGFFGPYANISIGLGG